MEQIQKQRQKSKNDESGAYLQDHPLDALETVDEDEVDDLLDEIDNVLEENAEEFVAAYVQAGGQ